MSNDPKIFGVMVEWKDEAPLIMEGLPMTHEAAVARMRSFLSDPRVIRVTSFKMIHSYGNESLIPKESEEA